MWDWDGKNQNKTHCVSHLLHWDTILKQAAIRPGDSDRCHEIQWGTNFKINYDSFNGAAKHRSLTQYNVFSDGSRIDEQTGAGFIIYTQQKKEITQAQYRLPNHATVFQAEVAAVGRAATAMCDHPDLNPRHVKFFVDSQAALRALGNPLIRSKTVSQAVQAIQRLATKAQTVTLVWIPAHKGHFGNEEVDALAKSGAKSNNSCDKLHLPTPQATLKAQMRDFFFRKWCHDWTTSLGAAHTKYFYYSPNPRKAKYVYKLARLELGRFVRLITGHSNLNYFQHKIGLWSSPRCRFCAEDRETFWHLLQSCPSFWRTRREMFVTTPSNDMTWSVRMLLDFSYIPAINTAFEGTWAHGDPVDNHDTLDSLDDCSERDFHSDSQSDNSATDGYSS